MNPSPSISMKTFHLTLSGLLAFHAIAPADDDIPLLRPEERQAVEAQTDEFQRSIAPVLGEAANSTVRVWSGKRRLAYGTVIGDGKKILTKWSEVAAAGKNLVVEGPGGEALPAVLTGVYEDNDLAILETTGTALTPVKWTKEVPPRGSFLAAPQPNGRLAAFGVVSVPERNLRETDSAFLGVIGSMDFEGPGVRIDRIAPDSGAAAAGLKAGQVILRVGDRPISGLLELKNSLSGRTPGSRVSVRVKTGKDESDVEVLLGNRPDLPTYPGDRLRTMERMGGPISRVRDSFTSAIQSDMRPRPEQIGGPVVDLEGRVIGITLARADRTRSFIMPAAAVEKLLSAAPADPSLAKIRRDDETAALPVRRAAMPNRVPNGGGAERLREHLSEMQRLMEFMQQEMENLEQER
jgi:S1-C subfamily serine protease